MEAMVAKLDLTEDQKIVMKEIMQDFRQKMRVLRDDNQGDRIAIRSGMQKLRKEQNSEVKDILTAYQFEAYEQLMKEQQAERRKRMQLRQRQNN